MNWRVLSHKHVLQITQRKLHFYSIELVDTNKSRAVHYDVIGPILPQKTIDSFSFAKVFNLEAQAYGQAAQ
jgi:hypothetical protein